MKAEQRLWARREFFRLPLIGLGLIALQPWEAALCAAVAPERLASARDVLKAIILEHAAAPDNPWLMIHGIRAMGKDFAVGNDPAVAYICRHYLKEQTINGKTYLYIAVEDEGHPNTFLSEGVLEAGVEPSYAFRVNERDYTIADCVNGAKALFAFDPGTFNPDDLAWSLIVFAHTTDPGRDSWTNGYGTTIRLSEVVHFGMDALDKATTRFATAMHNGVLSDEPDSIHEFTCGGIHLIHGLGTCLRFGHMPGALADRMRPQYDILVWRLESDSHYIDHHFANISPQVSRKVSWMYLLDAKLKFLGHAFEALNYARLFHLFTPTAAQEQVIARAQEEFLRVIDDLGRARIDDIKGDKTLFSYLIGDACHAYHGLTMAETTGVGQSNQSGALSP